MAGSDTQGIPRLNVATKPFSGMQRIHLGGRLIGVNVGKRGGAGAAAGERVPGSPRGRLRQRRRGHGRTWLPGPATVRSALVGAGAVVFFGGLAAVGLAAGARLTAGPGSPPLPPGLAPSPRGLAPARGGHGVTPQSTFVLTKGQAAMTTTTSVQRAARPEPAPTPAWARHPGYPRFSGGDPARPTVPGRPATTRHPRHVRHPRHDRHPRHAKRPHGQARARGQGQPKGHAQRPQRGRRTTGA
jgi:hypothetical protein